MNEDELRELEDPANWEDEGETRRPIRAPRAVVSVAFPRDDFEAVAEHARRHGMKTSEFIRRAALERARGRPEVSVRSVSGAVRIAAAPPPVVAPSYVKLTTTEAELAFTSIS